MSITFAAPLALGLLAVLPAVWVMNRHGRTNFNARQRALQTAVRSALLVLLAGALAQPVVKTATSRTSMLYLVDISHSVSGEAITDAALHIDALQSAVRPAQMQIIAFGAQTMQVADTAALRRLADVADRAGDSADRSGTDLAHALSVARSSLGSGAVPRIVVFSDGRGTQGDLSLALSQLVAEHVPVFVEPMEVRNLGDAWIEAVRVPDHVVAGVPAAVIVDVGSQRPFSNAMIAVADGTRRVAQARLSVKAGGTSVPVNVTFDTPGSHTLRVTLDPPGDVVSENNSLTRHVDVDPGVRVLYVEGVPASARYLRSALAGAGFDVAVRATTALPSTRAGFAAWDVVILSDVARDAMSNASMRAVAQWVELDGGGLLVAGGDSVFGENTPGHADGYRRTDLERVLPVTIERKDTPPVALMIVLDKSASMAGLQMELCKAAVQAAVDALPDGATMGLVTFSDGYTWDLQPRTVGENRDEIRRAVAAVTPNGATLIFPAVEQAYLALTKTTALAKHVVLLTDGRSYVDDYYKGLTDRMVADHITVSTVAVGKLADVPLLKNIAAWGQGRSYVVPDATQVPQIFVKEVNEASAQAFDEGRPIKPIVKTAGMLRGVDLTHLPDLHGRTAMALKTSATQILATDADDPLLAFWPIGLGRSAAFASDVKDRWASTWISWGGYAPFFSAVVRALARPHTADWTLAVAAPAGSGTARTVTIAAEGRNLDGSYLNFAPPSFAVRFSDGRTINVAPTQVAPGRYEASVVAPPRHRVTADLTVNGVVVATRENATDANAEYRFKPADESLLRSIASMTGGMYRPVPADVAKPDGRRAVTNRDVASWFLTAALALWLLDVLVRRLRLFESMRPVP